jgi:hypothetical protein
MKLSATTDWQVLRERIQTSLMRERAEAAMGLGFAVATILLGRAAGTRTVGPAILCAAIATLIMLRNMRQSRREARAARTQEDMLVFLRASADRRIREAETARWVMPLVSVLAFLLPTLHLLLGTGSAGVSALLLGLGVFSLGFSAYVHVRVLPILKRERAELS